MTFVSARRKRILTAFAAIGALFLTLQLSERRLLVWQRHDPAEGVFQCYYFSGRGVYRVNVWDYQDECPLLYKRPE